MPWIRVTALALALAACGRDAEIAGVAPSEPTFVPPPGRASATCADLAPRTGVAAVDYRFDLSPLPACEIPITDERGEWLGLGGGLKLFHYRFVREDAPGERTGSIELYGDGTIAPQPDGYHAVDRGTVTGPFRRYDGQGNLVAEGGTSWPAETAEPIPGGGSLVLTMDPATDDQRLAWMDAEGTERGRAALGPGGANRWAVSASGNVLVADAWSGAAQWYDRFGSPVGPGFHVPARGFSLQPLAGGDVAVRLPGARSPFRVADGAPAFRLPASWLDAFLLDPYWTSPLSIVLGGRANAVHVLDRNAPCGDLRKIEIYSAAGAHCGTLVLPDAPPPACARVAITADGTVATWWQTPTQCVYRWWPKLLR